LFQLAEEGAARVFKPRIGSDWVVGVVGTLQFEVMADRIRTEYDIPVHFESTTLHTARWVERDDPIAFKAFLDSNQTALADDHDDAPVFLARNAWHLDRTAQDHPKVRFLKTRG
jgi:peptide chain release factor 3